MSDETPSPVPAPRLQVAFEPIGSALAPTIFFNGAPNFGTFDGVANITLEAVHWHTADDGSHVITRTTVANLRAGLSGLASLEAAIRGIRLLLDPPASETTN